MTQENTSIPNEQEAREFEVKFLFAREEARKHGRIFSTKEDQEIAELRFGRLSDQDADYWLKNVYAIENEMVKHGTNDLRLFYPNNRQKPQQATRQPKGRRFVGRGSR